MAQMEIRLVDKLVKKQCRYPVPFEHQRFVGLQVDTLNTHAENVITNLASLACFMCNAMTICFMSFSSTQLVIRDFLIKIKFWDLGSTDQVPSFQTEMAIVGSLDRGNDMCGETENITSNLKLINESRNVSSQEVISAAL